MARVVSYTLAHARPLLPACPVLVPSCARGSAGDGGACASMALECTILYTVKDARK